MTAQQPPAPTPPPQPQSGAPGRGGIAQPPKKGSNVLLFILLGCGGVMLLGFLVVFAAGYFFYSAARNAGIDPGLMKRNPTLAAAKLAASNDPNIEFVDIDESKDTITIKEKKTGKIITLNAKDFENGKWSMHSVNADGTTEDFETDVNAESESGQIKIKTEKGSTVTQFGGQAESPAWIPVYPGGTAKSIMSTTGDEGSAGIFNVQTNDSARKVAAFYKAALEKGGFKVVESTVTQDKTTLINIGTEQNASGRNLLVSIVQEEGKPLNVTLNYQEKKE